MTTEIAKVPRQKNQEKKREKKKSKNLLALNNNCNNILDIKPSVQALTCNGIYKHLNLKATASNVLWK